MEIMDVIRAGWTKVRKEEHRRLGIKRKGLRTIEGDELEEDIKVAETRKRKVLRSS